MEKLPTPKLTMAAVPSSTPANRFTGHTTSEL
jgi:hypothetical protein